MRARRRAAIFSGAIMILYFFYEGTNISEERVSESIGENTSQGQKSKLKYILYWNEAYGNKDFGFCCGREPAIRYNCPVRDCVFTNNRSLLPDLRHWDAVWFASRSLPDSPLTGDLPSARDPAQRYIFWEIESPAYLNSFKPNNYHGFFNWTVTFRQDSTVRLPYGGVKKLRDHPEGEDLELLVDRFGRENADLAERKPGGQAKVAWMVSNCLTESNREGFVEDLRRHIDIDIYGSCYKDSLKCEKEKSGDCWTDISEKYMFYLSFENSICRDYVTEKFWEPLKRNIIPVVLGGANYSSIAPHHSHIDVLREGYAEDTKGLANLLKSLVENPKRYASYFWWKSYYSVIDNTDIERAAAPCEVCRKLHEDELREESVDMFDWWVGQADCTELISYDRDILKDLDDEEDYIDEYDYEQESFK